MPVFLQEMAHISILRYLPSGQGILLFHKRFHEWFHEVLLNATKKKN